MKYYIAYGSNLNIGQMAHRCPDASIVGTYMLKGYRLLFRRGVANIEPDKRTSVPIGIWKISESDERRLDRYEGYPRLYTKIYIPMDVDEKTVNAMAYVMTPGWDISGPSQYYLETIIRGYREFGIPTHRLLEIAHQCERIGDENAQRPCAGRFVTQEGGSRGSAL